MEWIQIFSLLGVGVLAGFINVMAGGGSSLSLPVLIFMGLDGASANGTNRVAICVQNIFAVAGFRKQQIHQFDLSLKFSLCALPGSILGAFVAVRIDDRLFQIILAFVILGVLLSILFPAFSRTTESPLISQRRWWISYLAMFGIGFYGGFIQVGVGLLIMGVLYHILRLNLVLVNMHKVFIVFIYTLPALGIFIWNDLVNWSLGLSLAAGNAVGGWVAAHISVKGGDKIIRVMLAVTLIIMSIKLFGFY